MRLISYLCHEFQTGLANPLLHISKYRMQMNWIQYIYVQYVHLEPHFDCTNGLFVVALS